MSVAEDSPQVDGTIDFTSSGDVTAFCGDNARFALDCVKVIGGKVFAANEYSAIASRVHCDGVPDGAVTLVPSEIVEVARKSRFKKCCRVTDSGFTVFNRSGGTVSLPPVEGRHPGIESYPEFTDEYEGAVRMSLPVNVLERIVKYAKSVKEQDVRFSFCVSEQNYVEGKVKFSVGIASIGLFMSNGGPDRDDCPQWHPSLG